MSNEILKIQFSSENTSEIIAESDKQYPGINSLMDEFIEEFKEFCNEKNNEGKE